MLIKSKMKVGWLLGPLCAAAFAWAPAALADSYAYMGTGTSANNFGVVDLSTGVFSLCGPMSAALSGLGVGPDHQLYGGAFLGADFYRVNLTNGALTQIGVSKITFFLTGSTVTQMYAVGFDSNLYTIDYTSGTATLVGPLGIAVSDSGWWGLSTNSKALYFTHGSTLYRLNLKTGSAKEIGAAGAGQFGSEVVEKSVLYGGAVSPPAIYTLNSQTGSSSLVAILSGSGVANPWGLAPIQEQSINPKSICKAHIVP